MSKIIPYLWFEDQAEESAAFYVSVFPNSRIVDISRCGEAGPGPDGSAMVVAFQPNGQEFMALMVPAGSNGQAPLALFVSYDTQDDGAPCKPRSRWRNTTTRSGAIGRHD